MCLERLVDQPDGMEKAAVSDFDRVEGDVKAGGLRVTARFERRQPPVWPAVGVRLDRQQGLVEDDARDLDASPHQRFQGQPDGQPAYLEHAPRRRAGRIGDPHLADPQSRPWEKLDRERPVERHRPAGRGGQGKAELRLQVLPVDRLRHRDEHRDNGENNRNRPTYNFSNQQSLTKAPTEDDDDTLHRFQLAASSRY